MSFFRLAPSLPTAISSSCSHYRIMIPFNLEFQFLMNTTFFLKNCKCTRKYFIYRKRCMHSLTQLNLWKTVNLFPTFVLAIHPDESCEHSLCISESYSDTFTSSSHPQCSFMKQKVVNSGSTVIASHPISFSGNYSVMRNRKLVLRLILGKQCLLSFFIRSKNLMPRCHHGYYL